MLKEHMERPFADVFADNPNHQPSSTRHVKHLQIILTLTTETTPGFKSFNKQTFPTCVVPKTTLRFNSDSVERLTELRKTLLNSCMIHYSEKDKINFSKGKRHTGQNPGETWVSSSLLSVSYKDST